MKGKIILTIKQLSLLMLLVIFVFGCAPPPTAISILQKPSTPLPPEPIKIDKPINVSFSTYSEDWPVDWLWIDPDEKHSPTPHNVKGGVLRIRIPSKKNLDGDKSNAPRYLKAISGNFQIETRVKFLPKENYQGAGLLIFVDDKNFLRFERAYGGLGGGGEGIRIDVQQPDRYLPIVTPNDIQTGAEMVDLKLVRLGRLITAFWRMDEDSEWRSAGEYESDFPETVLAGVLACNTARELTAEFGYIRLLPAHTK